MNLNPPKTPKLKPGRKPGRKPGQTSRAIAAAARVNGEAGGEYGVEGGRPRSKLPPDSVDRLGPPPADPLELVRWHAAVLAEVSWLSMQGLIGADLAASLRASAGTAARLLGPDVLAALDAKLDDRARGMKATATGPALEEVPNGQPDHAVRRAPR